MYVVLISFCVASVIGFLIIRSTNYHGRLTGDTVTSGPQKIHSNPVPRIGGLAVFLGFLAGVFWEVWTARISGHDGFSIAVCSLPAFAGGIYEDLLKKGGVVSRLLATFVSAGLAFWLLGAQLDRLDVPLFDGLLEFWLISILFTMFAAGGVSQSINIIDGLNGLAGAIGLLALSCLGLLANNFGDQLVLAICLSGIGGILGFFIWNFPLGKIFCGDGGAYFIGLLVAEVSILLVHRHQQISAWFPLMLSAYPIWETLFSAYRRKLLLKKAATQPDALHFHSLVYRWITIYLPQLPNSQNYWKRNALSSIVCWLLQIFSSLWALTFWNDTEHLIIGAVLFAAIYLFIYIILTRKTV